MLNGKVIIIHVIVGQIKKTYLYKMNYFLESYNYSQKNVSKSAAGIDI